MPDATRRWPSAAWPPLPDWPEAAPQPQLAARALTGYVFDRFEHADAASILAYQRGAIEFLLEHLRLLPGPQGDFWRERIDAARDHGELQWCRLAPLARDDFGRWFDADRPPRLGPDHGGVMAHATSGSSGTPVRFWVSERSQSVVAQSYHHDDRRHGRDPAALTLSIRGRLLDLGAGQPTIEQPFDPWRGEAWAAMRRARDLSIEELAAWVRASGARYLAAMPVVVDALLDHVASSGDAPPIEQVLSFAETVDARLRARCRALFGARVTDRYSCEEIGPLAFQCPRSDDYLHTAVAGAWVEVVDDQARPCAQGAIGHVLATSLHNYASPTLRYDVGDMAAWHAGCPACGFAGVTLSQLLGRRRQLLLRPDGSRRYFNIEAGRWLAAAPVRAQRITQTALDRLRVEVVASSPLSPAQKAALMHLVRSEAGPGYAIELQMVESLAALPSGKRQDFVCLVDQGPAPGD